MAIKLDFDSWESLKDIQLSPEEGAQDFPDFLGVVSLSNDEEGRLVFSRTVGAKKQEDADVSKEKKEENPFEALGAELMQGMLSGYSMEVHGPFSRQGGVRPVGQYDRKSSTVISQSPNPCASQD